MENSATNTKEHIAEMQREIRTLKKRLAQVQETQVNGGAQAVADAGEYLYVVSHELKAPLREIDLLAKFITEDGADCLPQECQADLAAIRQTCMHAISMIEHFMEYSRASAAVLNREILHMDELVRDCFLKAIRTQPERRIELEISELPDIISDNMLIRQMITNILSNSVKFTQYVTNAKIKVYSYRESDSVAFCFEDNGAGFDMRYAGNIFNVFERIHNESEFDGYGIGLATVKKIAERFEGSVDVFGRVNKGCTVTVRFHKSMVISLECMQTIAGKKKDRILIGVLYTTGGKYSSGAKSRRPAYEMAAEEINRSGGIDGKQIELIFRDFMCDIDLAEEQAWELIEVEKVDVLMGGYLSPVRERIRKIAGRTRTLYLYNSQYEGGVADHYTFCTSAVPEQNIFPIIDYLSKQYGKRLYILVTDYNYGILTAECVKDYIAKTGGEIVGTEYFLPSKLNFKVTIENIAEVMPDILFTVLMGDDQNDFHRQWHESGLKHIPVISATGVNIFYLHKMYAAPTMENAYFMCSYLEESDTEPARLFTRKMREQYPRRLLPYIEFDAEPAYSAVYLYKAAVELAGTTDTEAVIRALESGRVCFNGPGGMVTIRGEDHHTARDVTLFRMNQQHEVEILKTFSAIHSDFVEQIVEQDTGMRGGLATLGVNAPNVQYNPMFHNTF